MISYDGRARWAINGARERPTDRKGEWQRSAFVEKHGAQMLSAM
jgi:hypothetical protein